ncbi:hypothetical protein QQ008_27160 [Fulvivirgaceae bacterium BMA10]|uniref:Endonuclease/exonuclease/phosphatase domain-containing protein n=1 Tax=Splendidivirga corallicola TaxID=3051826 RepID=A0ABT8KWC6_9BACT|nr:hypothetical protein [Fulvivirgaceae bacterium BMA10]
MEKAFSVSCWNVEHFGKSRKIGRRSETRAQVKERIKKVVDFVDQHKGDILAISEVSSYEIFETLTKKISNYNFFITEGEQSQEILVGIKNTLNAYVMQKTEFKSQQSSLRPGVLVTVHLDDQYYPVLFLHLKSMPDPKGFGLRDDMITRACDFRNKIVKGIREKIKVEQGLSSLPKAKDVPAPNYIFVGDLNTMGLDYKPAKKFDIPPANEINDLKRRAKNRQMRLLSKTADATWYNGSNSRYDPGNLDHVVAMKHLKFMDMGGGAEVKLRGWPEIQDTTEQDKWIEQYSDHALLYFEVCKV